KVWMDGGTQLRDVDALGLNSGAYERVPGCHPAVEIPVAVAPFRGQSTHRRIALRSLRVDKEPAPELGLTESGCFESVAHVRADLIATCTDRRARRHDEIRRAARELLCEHRDCGRRDAPGQSTPP